MKRLFEIQALLAAAALLGAATARADVVVIGNPGAAPLTKEAVADIYLGKNPGFTPLDQAESAPIRGEFYTKATGRDAAQVKATWARLVFSGKAQLPKELPDSAAVKKAVVADPKAVGYVEKGAVDGTVKVLYGLD